MAKYEIWWRPVDAETAEPLCKGEIFGCSRAATQAITHQGHTIIINNYKPNSVAGHYRIKGETGWRSYTLKQVRRGASCA